MCRLLLLAVIACSAAPVAGDRRSVVRVAEARPAAPANFDRAKSTALFVGVREFASDANVPVVWFTVDDAIDLAYAFAMERNVRLVPPQRVVLALAGEAMKAQSREHLIKLKAAGASVVPATKENILTALRAQAERAGAEGLFVAGFASHGFTVEGTPYILASTSLFDQHETSLSAAKVFDLAAAARRSLILIDACRERVVAGRRGPTALRDTAPLTRRMSSIDGQVVFYAGTYAYDDFRARNGVFTRAILEGLRCEGIRNATGVVTVEALGEYVEKRVKEWIRANRDPRVRSATRIQFDGNSETMPLASCVPPTVVAEAKISGSTVIAIGQDRSELWRHDLTGTPVGAEVADLNGDKANEVVAGTASGELVAFSSDGERLWSTTIHAADGAAMTLRTFITADLFRRKTQQIVALATDRDASAPSRLVIIADDGTVHSTFSHPGPLDHVVVDRLTARHAPKIIVAGTNRERGAAVAAVFMLEPKRLAQQALWYGVLVPPAQAIQHLGTVDHDNDGKRDIVLRTSKGRVFLTFDGRVLDPRGTHVSLLAK